MDSVNNNVCQNAVAGFCLISSGFIGTGEKLPNGHAKLCNPNIKTNWKNDIYFKKQSNKQFVCGSSNYIKELLNVNEMEMKMERDTHYLTTII